MRVALLSHSAGHGGTEGCILRLARGLRERGLDPLVVVPGSGPLREALEASGVRTRELFLPWWVSVYRRRFGDARHWLFPLVRDVARLAAVLRPERVDVVDTATSVLCQGALVAPLLGAAHVWHLREIYPSPWLTPHLGVTRTLRAIVRGSRRIVVPSRAVVGSLGPTDRVRVIPESIDDAMYEPAARSGEFRAQLGIGADEPLIAVLAPLYAGKDALTAVRALAMLAERGIRAHLALCGAEAEPGYEARVLQESARLSVRKQVHRLAFQARVREVYDDLDVLWVTSQSESFGLTIVEEAACGVPVVSTRCGGPEEIVRDGETGYLVEIGDVEAFADRSARLLRDCELRAGIVRSAREEALRYRTVHNVDATIAVYAETMREKGG